MLWRIVRGMLRLDGTAGDRVAGPLQVDRGGVLQALFDEVGQFEVLEEHVEELFLGQRELERVLAATVGAAFASRRRPSPPCGRGISSPRTYSLLPGHDVIGAAGAPAVVERRLGDAARRDGDLLAMLDIGDLALAQARPAPPI